MYIYIYIYLDLYLFCIAQGSDVDTAASVYSETNTATINSLIPGSIYAFQIRARNERGFGPYSSTIYFTTLPLGTPLCCRTCDLHVSQSALLQSHTTEPVERTILWGGGINPPVTFRVNLTPFNV